MDLKPINLLNLDLSKISGDFVKINKDKNIIFPQILNILASKYPLHAFNVYDGFYLNNKIIYIYDRYYDYVLYNLDRIYNTPNFNGFCVFGEAYFIFYQDKCLIIDTVYDTAKVVSLTIDGSRMSIIKVKQITPQLFAIITANPTTIHLFGLDSAGVLASANNGDQVNLNSFSYASFSNPTVNVDLIAFKDRLYLIGDDYSVVLNMNIKDIIYLQTQATYDYRYTPFREFENKGIKFIRETQSFYVFYNTLFNSYIYTTKDFESFYLGRDTVFLTPNVCFNIQKDDFYLITDILQTDYKAFESYHEVSFRLSTPYIVFKSARVYIPEIQQQEDRIASLTLEARYENGYNIWSYGVMYNRFNYRILARGTDFVITLRSNNALRLEEFILWA
jgi:hypothetical protein